MVFVLFSSSIFSQEKEIDSIQIDSLSENKFLLDKVKRKAKGFPNKPEGRD